MNNRINKITLVLDLLFILLIAIGYVLNGKIEFWFLFGWAITLACFKYQAMSGWKKSSDLWREASVIMDKMCNEVKEKRVKKK